MSTDPRNAWNVADVFHQTTGQTIEPDAQTGDEWTIERVNAHYPRARVLTTYAVTRRPTDENGNWLDTSEVPDEDAHPFWRYAVAESTEYVTSSEAGDDFWFGNTDQDYLEYGEGSYLDYADEASADAECERMARRDAAMTGTITWAPSNA